MKDGFKGFTLIEALVAITILTVGILSGLILISRSLYDVTIIRDRIRAVFLAQEGIELVREIRDSNFMRSLSGEQTTWNEGLGEGIYIIENHADDSDSIKLIPITPEQENNREPKLCFNPETRLYFYENTCDNLSPFFREIKIEKVNDNEIKVLSVVKWRSKNIPFEIKLEDHLYNWLSSFGT